MHYSIFLCEISRLAKVEKQPFSGISSQILLKDFAKTFNFFLTFSKFTSSCFQETSLNGCFQRYIKIIECLDLFGVAENIKSLLVNSMEKRKVMPCSGHSQLAEVEIKRGIFQGHSLSSLVFVLALIPLSLILRKTKAAYEISESKDKINHLLFMDDLKLK